MTTANNADYNLSPWKPGQSGNPSGRPFSKGHRYKMAVALFYRQIIKHL